MAGASGQADGIVRARDLQPRPWPNGLGITCDVVRRDMADGSLLWLISIADLTGSADFSHFPNCDRCFTLIEGGPVTLTIAPSGPMLCLPFRPSCFPGDRPTFCTMDPAPARAFNLFFNRTAMSAAVVVRTIAAAHRVHVAPTTAAVFCASGEVEIGDDVLRQGDTLIGRGPYDLHTGPVDATVITVDIFTA